LQQVDSESRNPPEAELLHYPAEVINRVAVLYPMMPSSRLVHIGVYVRKTAQVSRLVVKRAFGPLAYAMPSIECRTCTDDGYGGLRPLEINAGGIGNPPVHCGLSLTGRRHTR
jgi:hypothetical protein